MYSSKLFTLLKTFSEEDWKWFKSEIIDFEKEKSQKKIICGHIYKHRKNLGHKRLSIEYMCDSFFSHLSKKSFQNLLSIIQQDVLNKLTIHEILKDQELYTERRLKALRDRGLYDWHDKVLATDDNNRNQKNIGFYTSFWKFKISLDTYTSNHPIKNKSGQKILETIINNWNNVQKDMGLLTNLISIYREQLFNEEWHQAYVIKEKNLNSHVQKCLYHLRQMKEELNGDSTNEIENIVYDPDIQLTQNLQIMCCIGLLDYYRESNLDYKQNAKSVFKINDYMHTHNLLLIDQKLSLHRFVNCISLATSPLINNIPWAMNFLETYEGNLDSEDRENTILIGKSLIGLAKENYEKAIDLINQANPKSAYLKILKYTIQIRAFYIYNEDYEFLMSQVKNMRGYLIRNKDVFSDRSRIGFFGFLEAMLRLLKKEFEALKISLEMNTSHVFFKAWILKQIEEKA